jgi:hypothetical protein
MKHAGKFILFSMLIFFLQGCAFDVVHIKQIPIEIDTSQTGSDSFLLEKEVDVNLGTGYSRTLKKETRWDYVGHLSYGDVFKTKDQILTVEGSNIYEAYIVVSEGKLVGFYLPVEDSYCPLGAPEELHISKHQKQ